MSLDKKYPRPSMQFSHPRPPVQQPAPVKERVLVPGTAGAPMPKAKVAGQR